MMNYGYTVIHMYIDRDLIKHTTEKLSLAFCQRQTNLITYTYST